MTTADVLPAPILQAPVSHNKWASEYASFRELLPRLLLSHRGQYVAIHNGKVVGSGPDKFVTARKAYAEFGPVAILVTLVTDEPQQVVRIIFEEVVGPH